MEQVCDISLIPPLRTPHGLDACDARLPVKPSLNAFAGHDVSCFVLLPFVQQDLIHVN